MEVDPSLPWRQVRGEGFGRLVGPFRFARAGDGLWHACLNIEERHLNVGGVCHGGVLMGLADVAMGTASHDAADGHPCATIDFGCHFLAAVKNGQAALAVVHQVRRTRDLSFMGCEIHAGGRLCVRASGIWKYRASGRPDPSGRTAP